MLGDGRRENAVVEVGHDSDIDMKRATITDTKGLIIIVDEAACVQVALKSYVEMARPWPDPSQSGIIGRCMYGMAPYAPSRTILTIPYRTIEFQHTCVSRETYLHLIHRRQLPW